MGNRFGPVVEKAVSLPVVLRPEAGRDVEEARDFLDAIQSGLGQAFLGRLKATLDNIAGMPEMYAIVWRSVRAARLARFTYVVYFRILHTRVEVIAIMHGSRDAGPWKARA